MAKKTRGAVSSVALSVPNVDSITVTATNTTPGAPISRCATSAATSFERRISSTASPRGSDVGEQVDRDDGEVPMMIARGSTRRGSRTSPRRTRVGPSVERPQHRHEREPERGDVERAAGAAG
jgi:hypothetical protein